MDNDWHILEDSKISLYLSLFECKFLKVYIYLVWYTMKDRLSTILFIGMKF